MQEKEFAFDKETVEKEVNKKHRRVWIVGLLLAFVGALLMLSRYPQLSGIDAIAAPSVESFTNLQLFPKLNYVLYQNLYNNSNEKVKTYSELYGPTEYPELIIDDEMLMHASSIEWEAEYYLLKKERADLLNTLFYGFEGELLNLTIHYDYIYWIQDSSSGKILTNSSYTEQHPDANEFAVFIEFIYDEMGNVTIGNVKDTKAEQIKSQLYQYSFNYMGAFLFEQDTTYSDVYMGQILEDKFFADLQYGSPVNCVVIYAVPTDAWNTFWDESSDKFWSIYDQYRDQQLGLIYAAILIILAICGWYYANPKLPRKRDGIKLKRLPFEASIGLLFVMIAIGGGMILEYATWLYLNYGHQCHNHGIGGLSDIGFVAYSFNILCITIVFLIAWYCGCCLGEIRVLGAKDYFSRRSLLKKAWNRLKAWIKRYYNSLVMLDVTGNVKKKLRTLLIINAVVLFLFTSLWFFGWVGVLLYSLLLYWVLKRYISDIQKKYSSLLNATNQIADGNLNVTIEENLGVFEAFKPQIYRIQEGFKKAVDEEVKSQKMKNELITNVSHDLKTPLTAIITYVNLLKEENISEEERKQYLDILEMKSLRLKGLIEDLFEVSKANSGNVTLNPMDVDLVNLLKQVNMEWEDKLQEKHLTTRLRLPEEKLIVKLDSQKAYRIYENLFGNIYKYALEGTRIYVDIKIGPDNVSVFLKNITAAELNVSAEELTERFVRGDASRGTEGSGLGLAIVKSFTELMGGRFYIQLDGDLFTAITVWPISW